MRNFLGFFKKNVRHIVIGVGSVLVLSVVLALTFLALPRKNQAEEVRGGVPGEKVGGVTKAGDSKDANWKEFSSQAMNIAFEVPANLHAFPLRDVSLAANESEPSTVEIHTDFVEAKTVDEAVAALALPSSQKILEKRKIVGTDTEVLITSFTGPDAGTEQKIVYALHDNVLYTISVRWIDVERLVNSLRFR